MYSSRHCVLGSMLKRRRVTGAKRCGLQRQDHSAHHRHQHRRRCRSLCAAGCAVSRQAFARRADDCRRRTCRALVLWSRRTISYYDRQAGWLDVGRFARRSVFRSGAGPQHGEVRLGEVYLDRLAGTARSAALHARRQPVQDARRYPARQRSRRAAAARALARRAISCRKSWKKLSVSNSKR